MSLNIQHTVTDRFLRYAKIDTQSDPESTTYPTTEKQKDLARVLVNELKQMGIEDVETNDFGYVYATIPANTSKNVPTICFCSHMDTSPDCSGKNVNPILHKNYDGGDIVLPNDNAEVLTTMEHPDLKNQIGNTVITADGTTLLGADNKAGLAEIMDAAHHLITHSDIPHGEIKILFTPDEEVGKGVDNVDMEKLGADFGYTMDGEMAGSIEDETFSADMVTLTINGRNIHPGFAKNKLENAIKIAAEIMEKLPKDSMSPETTAGREDFIHPITYSGNSEQVVIKLIIRSFETQKLKTLEDFLQEKVNEVMANYKWSSCEFEVTEQYRNMKEVLDKHPEVVQNAVEALKRAGLTPIKREIRGGTDGSRLSFMGLPCPNIFAGEHAFHGKQEWVSVEDMQKAVETIVHLCMIWEERS